MVPASNRHISWMSEMVEGVVARLQGRLEEIDDGFGHAWAAALRAVMNDGVRKEFSAENSTQALELAQRSSGRANRRRGPAGGS